MAALTWDASGKRLFETGVQKGVLYPVDSSWDSSSTTTKKYSNGYAWNGLTGVTESPTGAEATALYADDKKYLNLYSAEELEGTVEAYTYPDEFAECDGTYEPVSGMTFGQQTRKMFGLAYRTTLGNDSDGNDYGYKLHLIYGCMASPSEKAYSTINDSPEAITFSWSITTTPETFTIDGTEYSTASITIDSTKFATSDAKALLKSLEDKLYGTTSADPYLPLPDEVYSTLKGSTVG